MRVVGEEGGDSQEVFCPHAITGGRESSLGQLHLPCHGFLPISAIQGVPHPAAGLLLCGCHGQGLATDAPTEACGSHRRFPLAWWPSDPRAERGRGRGSGVAPSPAPNAHPQHMPAGSTSVAPTRGASLKKLDFANTFCGHCFNFPVSQHSLKPEKLRWFLLCAEGGSCCRTLTNAHITHTQRL